MEEVKQNKKRIDDNNSEVKVIDVKPQKIGLDYSTPITISRKMRCIVFTILNIVFILMGLDQGILSSTTSHLTEDIDIKDTTVLGGLGGMIFLGTAIGCVFSFTLINKFNRKYLLLATLCFDVLSLFLTTQTTKIPLLYLCRVIAGLTQSFLAIYIPVWSDQFGIHKYKSIWLSIVHISSSLGYLFGYILGIIMEWENSFYLQNILIIIHIVIIFFVLPDLYFSMNLLPLKAKLNLIKEKDENKIIKDIKNIDIDMNSINNDNNELLIKKNEEKEEKEEKEKKEEKEEKESNSKKEEDEISLFEDIQVKNEDIRKISVISHLKVLIKSPIFILMNITLASMFIIVSAVQFWINDYLENGLLVDDEKKRLYAFAFVVITSPVGGIILGGILTNKLGGYDTEKAIYIPLITSFLVCILANIIPLTSNLYVFIPLFWTYLFLGSVLLPVVSGIILVSVDKKFAGSASSVSTLLYNILGRLPGPILYGFYKSQVDDKHSRIPFWLLLNMAIPGFIAVLICIKFQKEKYRKLRNQLNEEKEIFLDSENINKENKNDIKEMKENIL